MSRFGRAVLIGEALRRTAVRLGCGFIRCGSRPFLFKRASVVVCGHDTDFPFFPGPSGEIKSQGGGWLRRWTGSYWRRLSRTIRVSPGEIKRREGVRGAGLSRERPGSQRLSRARRWSCRLRKLDESFAASVVLLHQPLYRRYSWQSVFVNAPHSRRVDLKQQLAEYTIVASHWPARSPLMMMSWCLMSSDVMRHIRDKLWPMPKHGAINLYVHGNQKAR